MGELRTRPRLLGVLALLLALPAGPVGPAAADAQDSPLARGVEAVRTGQYDAAARLLGAAVRTGTTAERVEAARRLSRTHLIRGEYGRALEALDAAQAAGLPASELARSRGRVLRALGRDDDAGAAFDRAVEGGASDAVPARLDRAILRWERGDRGAAYAGAEAFIDLYNQGRARSVAELLAVGDAVRLLGRRDPDLFHDAVRAYEEALAVDRRALEPRLRLADLFLDKYDAAEARQLYGEVLEVNPRHPEALVGLARAGRFEGSIGASDLVDRALEVNPRSVRALVLRGLLRVEVGEEGAAVADADAALAVNPRSREALALRAAAHHLADDSRAAESDWRRALAIDSRFAGAFLPAAEIAVRRGRYRDAVALARRAVAVDSTAWEARSLLGMNLLRTGELEAARRELERAFEGDPFNVWTRNTLDLLDRLASFETRRTEHFELVLDTSEADLLALYAGEVAEEAYRTLSERYGHRPETPVRVEVYPSHADFSVRTMGLPGLGALGVAFGNVLAMDSPAARDRGAFHWGSTLWHEIAHAVTLGLTRHRIPRWLTEGISVREERRARPGWGGAVALEFLTALRQDRLLPLTRIDDGFIRPSYPGQVGVSYQHAGLLVEWIEEEHGAGAVRRLLSGYADRRSTDRVFRDAVGLEPEAVDRAFHAWVRGRFAAGLAAVGTMDEDHGATTTGTGAGEAALVRTARTRPGDFAAQLRAGRALLTGGRADEAEPFLERARDLFPEYAGPGSPYALLARLRRERGDLEGAVVALRRLTALDETAYEANLELAELLEARGDPAGAAGALERAVFISPYDPAVHDRLARLAERLNRPALEVRERRAIVALRPVDRAGALYHLAIAHRRAGDVAAARRAALDALAVAPSYADAQELLLELSEGGT